MVSKKKRGVKIKIGKNIFSLDDLKKVELIENGRKIMEGNIIAIIRKSIGELEELERKADEELRRLLRQI